jgi:site-specific DNA-methyltransferase (adenine-specific)
MKPYFEENGITIYHGDCREVLPSLRPTNFDAVITDPPYPNNAAHFIEDIEASLWFIENFSSPRWLIFWDVLEAPPVKLPLVARHGWRKSNTNRPGNYEAIYEFADEPRRASRMFNFPVIYPGLTGCSEATGHPTQKPLKLMKELVELRKPKHIIDPFMGSGATLEAAQFLGIEAVGIDRELKNCADAANRLRQSVLHFAVNE